MYTTIRDKKWFENKRKNKLLQNKKKYSDHFWHKRESFGEELSIYLSTTKKTKTKKNKKLKLN